MNLYIKVSNISSLILVIKIILTRFKRIELILDDIKEISVNE